MKPIEFIYLSQEDVLDINLSLKEVIDLVEKGLGEHGRGMVENPPKPGIHPQNDAFIHAMPAYLGDSNICGLKWVSGFPGNRAADLPQILGLLVLNDVRNGIPLCVMDCRWVTAVRTAAVTAVTAKYCAGENAEKLGVIGAGVQGRYNLLALKEVIPGIEEVRVFDINKEAAEKYSREFTEKLGVKIILESDIESIAKESDILLTATQRLEKPLIKDEWFQKGCLGFGLEASRAWYGDAILNCDKFITDDWEQTKHYRSQGAFPDGLPELYAELGSIVCGNKPGRETEDERILAISMGLALEDMIVAQRIYEIARENKNVTKLTLMEKEF